MTDSPYTMTELQAKRHALQIACMLPEGKADALLVLEHVRELVMFMHSDDGWMAAPPAPDTERDE
jgi:hypothetical protein